MNVGTKVIEELHHFSVAVLSCDTSWSSSIRRVLLIKVRPHLVQQPYDIKLIPLSSGKGYGRSLPRIDEI